MVQLRAPESDVRDLAARGRGIQPSRSAEPRASLYGRIYTKDCGECQAEGTVEITSARCGAVDAFAATRLAIGAGFLIFAAASDVRTLKVRDPVWIALGSIGLAILAVQLASEQAALDGFALLGSSAILFYTIFFGKPLLDEEGFRARPLRILLFLVAAALFLFPAASRADTGESLPPGILELYAAPAMVVLYQALYRTPLLHGGADVKGLIALTLLVPTYPDLDPFPILQQDPRIESVLRIFFPFSLIVWVNAALLALALPVFLLVRNAIKGDLAFPQGLLGYRVPIDAVPPRMWLMERVNQRGEHVLVLFPRRGGNRAQDLARLREVGSSHVWVTPKIPLVSLLPLGFVLSALVGNVLLWIVSLGA